MREILICGGGVAGAGMACALANLDVSVTLLEKDQREEVGNIRRGEGLRSEVSRILTELGLMAYFERQNPVLRKGERRELWHSEFGKLGDFRYDYLAPEYPVMHLGHRQIVEALYQRIEQAANVDTVFGAEATSVGEYKDGKRNAVYKSRTEGTEQEVSADLVILADGGGSALRRQAGIPTEQYDYGVGYLMFYLAKPEAMHWGRFYVGPDGFIGVFPTPGDMVRAAVEVKVGELKGWLSAAIDEQRRRLVRRSSLLKDCELRDVGIFYHVIRRHANRYTQNGLCLIGDAAHTTHPMLAQGISLVFNDIRALYHVLSANQNAPLTDEVLRQYEQQARPYNSQVLQNNHELFSWLVRIGQDPDYLKVILPEMRKLGFEAPLLAVDD